MQDEIGSKKRFFEQLVKQRVENRAGSQRSVRNIALTFVADGDEYLYPIGHDLSTIDYEAFAYVQQLATKAGIDVRVESINSSVAKDSNTTFVIGEDHLGKVDRKPAQGQHRTLLALSGVIVSKVFRECAWKSFPDLKKHPGYWVLFSYLLFGSWHDEDTSRLLLCAEILSAIEGRDPDNSQAEKFLIRFRDEVLSPVGADILWTLPNGELKKCRHLKKRYFGNEFEEILRYEHLEYWNGRGRVYLLSGSACNRFNARRFRRAQREAAGQLPAFCEHAELIRRYMNTLKSNLFTKKVRENFRSTLKAVFNLPDGPVRDAQLRILRHINGQPQPFYFPSKKGRTVRLSTSEGIPNLKSNIRRALTKGWDEVDLRSSQFAICASLWQVPDLLDFLRTGQNLWSYLFETLNVSFEERELAKPVFKEAIYSICYGMPRKGLNWTITGNLGDAGLDTKMAHEFLQMPLIKTLLNARDAALETIYWEGGAMTCYNKWLAVGGERQPRDIMAAVAQAWEMKLIYPAFELAQQTSEFKIVLYQYDGFSVHFRQRPELWKRRIEEAINDNAHREGFMTWIEWS